jgi:hypothetical protein
MEVLKIINQRIETSMTHLQPIYNLLFIIPEPYGGGFAQNCLLYLNHHFY